MNRLENQPKYKIGQLIIVEIKTKDINSDLEFTNKIKAEISEIKSSGFYNIEDAYTYGITTDMPSYSFYGKPPFIFINEGKIVLAD